MSESVYGARPVSIYDAGGTIEGRLVSGVK
jgi:hypothetical protein